MLNPSSSTARTNESPQDGLWTVVGGGMIGMYVAWQLAKKGARVRLIDAAPALGGLTSAWKIGDVVWDKYYHVTLLSDNYLRSLLQELDLDKEIEWVQTRTGFYSDGRLHSLSNSLEFLRFPILSLYQKLRLGATIFLASKRKDWKALENITVEAWLRKWSGDSTFEKIWLPLLKCKLGDAYQRTNAAFIWAYIQRMYAARRSGLKQEMFGIVRGGYQRVLSEFASRLEKSGIEIVTGCKVTKIERNEKHFEIAYETDQNRSSMKSQRVILTVPSPIVGATVIDLTKRERELVEGTEYLGVVCTSLLLDQSLGGFYVTNITDPGIPLTGIIEMGTLLPPSRFGGNYLVYLPRYLLSNDEGFDEPDTIVHERCLNTLQRMYPSFRPESVRAIQTARARYVMALPTIGYSENLPPVICNTEGLFLLNSARIVDGTLNVNEVLRLVDRELPEIWNRVS
jgi:protoporphyrinogen oxidase